jgi:toxin ParE1/3/4
VRVGFHAEADDEFLAQVEFYERRERGLGERFYRHVMDCLEWIQQNPSLPRDRNGVRRVNLTAFPFYIAYRVEGDLIWVVAVARGSRRPGYWKNRL